MAKKKDFSAFDDTSGINSFLSEGTKRMSERSPNITGMSTHMDEAATVDNPSPKRGRPRQYTNTLGEAVSRSEKITIYLTAEQNQMVDYIARIKGVSKSKLLTDIVNEEMQKPEYQRAYDAMRDVQARL